MIEVDIDKDVYLPAYYHLLEESDIDIELIWGGRDSGKSKFVAQYFTEQAMSLDYFRCLLIKETHESIKDAQWQMIKDTSEQWNDVHKLFRFSTSPLGIRCLNGNTFATRGMDKPAKLRSFSNPSHAWIEEGNQISEEAFITIITGLRSDYGKVKLIFSFNPEANVPDYQDFWLYKMFFKEYEGQLNFTGEIVVRDPKTGKPLKDDNGQEVSLKFRSTHTTYHDNPYVTPQRIAFHESLETTNPYWYRVFTLGLWGNIENDSPYAFAFDRNKHVSNGHSIPHPVLNRLQPLILSWDFNRNPMTCDVIQNYDNKARVLEVIRLPKAGVDGMCQYITVHYSGCLYLVTGDYNGDNESSLFQEHITHYKLIKQYLNLSDGQIKIRPNPKQAKNSTHINTVFAYYDVVFHGVNARALIFDCENVKRRADGTILKTDRDKQEQQADALDAWRYFCNEFLAGFTPTEEMILSKVKSNNGLKLLSSSRSNTSVTQSPERGNVAQAAIASIEAGNQVICSKAEYHQSVRNAILQQAGIWVDSGDSVRATIALKEVQRLDNVFK